MQSEAVDLGFSKVRDREGAIAGTRGACAPQIFRFATFADSVFHHPHETSFDLARFLRVNRFDGTQCDEF
jgi:hypothetical protein